MSEAFKIWGVHNAEYGEELIKKGFVSIGWDALGDLRKIGNDQQAMRSAVEEHFPSAKPGALSVWAGILRRFAFDAKVGDVVIFPNKQNRTLNFGEIVGEYYFDENAQSQKNRRAVRWLPGKIEVARQLFTQKALYEVGSALTMFAVKNNAEEFWKFINGTEQSFVESPSATVSEQSVEELTDSAAEMPTADRIDQNTRDYIAEVLLSDLSHEEFEHFTADLLRCMGYQARVTQFGSDGGIDVIAHKDLLGLEPPIIKVQCKHTVQTQGRPTVQQLIGTLDKSEAGLFFTLGSYSSEALAVERERQNVRLFSGSDITDLALKYYDELPRKWRSRMPLRRVFAVESE